MIQLISEDGTTRFVEEGKPYRLQPGERIERGIAGQPTELDKIGIANNIPLGDMTAKLIASTPFKKWHEKYYGKECAKCQQRQASLNFIKFAGPKWLNNWVKTIKD